ncbi:hypothetical protein GBAR_LOCUS55 [Geodia barretti]|uniref:Uncharacterized protein n=1 Tax=Geodia barretti TaxID=519541 RepID=A0AA35W2P3_GEOBA|nr:hypothetical protein GBAR_LOCUS55 [Geodia barretti]
MYSRHLLQEFGHGRPEVGGAESTGCGRWLRVKSVPHFHRTCNSFQCYFRYNLEARRGANCELQY